MEDEFMVEVWTDITELTGYQVSTLGRIRKGGRLSQLYTDSRGKLIATFTVNKKRISRNIARLVLDHFVSIKQKGQSCAYKDGNVTNLKLSNLYWKGKPKSKETLSKITKYCSLPVYTEEELSNEVWKQVHYAETYEISNLGRLRNNVRGKIIYNKMHFACNKYCFLDLYSKGYKVGTFLIHRLVLETFIGLCPEGMECRHADGNTWNNKLSNLSWGTHLENAQDTINLGRQTKGDTHPNAKLTQVDIDNIRKILASCTGKDIRTIRITLCEQYGVSKALICKIAKNKHRV